jgi:hypothetical protein
MGMCVDYRAEDFSLLANKPLSRDGNFVLMEKESPDFLPILALL